MSQHDTDGASIVRQKAAQAGWVYGAIPFEFSTSTLGSMYSKEVDNDNRTGITFKLYDINGVEITQAENEVNCVRTEIDFEPPYSYEVIGGSLRLLNDINADCRLYVTAVPDIPYANGGSREMLGGLNLKFLPARVRLEVDGRVAKYLKYDINLHTNKLRFTFKHDAGLKVSMLLFVEQFSQ